MTSSIDPSQPVIGTPTTASVRSNFQFAHDEIGALQTAVAAAAPIASPALTGNPTAPTPPLADNDASIPTTAWVKGQGYVTGGPFLPLAGGALTGRLTPAQPAGIAGTVTNDNAAPGAIGEYIFAIGGPIALTAYATNTIGSIPLGPGDWDVSINCSFNGDPATVVGAIIVGLNTIPANVSGNVGWSTRWTGPGAAGSTQLFVQGGMNLLVGPVRVVLSAAATIYLNASGSFVSGACTSLGIIQARRMR